MKQSKYNFTFKDDSGNDVLYNTYTRDFIIRKDEPLEWITGLDQFINQSSYFEDEAAWMMKLTKRQFLLGNEVDELEKVRGKITEQKEQTDRYMIVLKTTLDCNFRCVYCNQYHEGVHLTDEVVERTIRHVERVSKTHKHINFAWFGGEPLLEFEKMYQMSMRMIEICKKNDCEYSSAITTNGYLLTPERIALLEEMKIQHAQITIDGYKEAHDQVRPHLSGEGTYTTVFNNLVNVLESSMNVTLRINVNSDNVDAIPLLLEDIPKPLRLKVSVSLANWFQEKQKKSLYELYKLTVEMGFKYSKNKNTFGTCERTYDLLTSIMPNGRIVLCSEIYNQNESFGYLDMNGQIVMDSDFMIQQYARVPSAVDREMCQNCIELPICIGGCLKARVSNLDYCARKVPDGMSVVEKAKLDILSDKMRRV